ncbi:hypothetical protein D5S18_08545 [Nocardia panacis]|uniref:Secreted protein n=1 Tax=Nocardia panacis TaxID=2340916 RepID=A0A3A4KS59_9NOCA|nr:hypothetical protein [Nocardia panacis]RJO76376.1 hypothetical protein D5S18_08545 [Nocardia panacis]
MRLRTIGLCGIAVAGVLAGSGVAAADDSQQYICDSAQVSGGRALGMGNCVAVDGGAPAMGFIVGDFTIAGRDNSTIRCAGNGGMPVGEAALPLEVNGWACATS